MIFERDERVAFARILSDLIEADFIVEEDEMESFDKIKDEKDFRITIDMLSEAKAMTFAEAVSTLAKLREPEKKALIIQRLYDMSLADGTCVPLEALQILAVKYSLEGKGQVFSIPEGSSYIENMKVLYIENEDDTDIEADISLHYRTISNEFRLAGFDFVYIPQIVEDYRSIRGEYLHKVISYMIPSLPEAKVEKIQHDLCSMTTSRFSHELLYKKMGINMLSSKPALLFKVGESAVADKSASDEIERNIHSNFLLVPVCQILDQVVELMDTYRSMVNCQLQVEARPPHSKKFLYYGFHRSLFDLIAYGRSKTDYKLVINLQNRTNPVVLRPINADPDSVIECDEDLPIGLTPQPYALYILMVYLSLRGKGMDWKDYGGNGPIKNALLRQYNVIYAAIGKGNTNTEYRDKSHVSRIKKSLRSQEKLVSNIDLFIPEKKEESRDLYYRVPIAPSLVYVIEGAKGQEREVRMIDSELWQILS